WTKMRAIAAPKPAEAPVMKTIMVGSRGQMLRSRLKIVAEIAISSLGAPGLSRRQQFPCPKRPGSHTIRPIHVSRNWRNAVHPLLFSVYGKGGDPPGNLRRQPAVRLGSHNWYLAYRAAPRPWSRCPHKAVVGISLDWSFTCLHKITRFPMST